MQVASGRPAPRRTSRDSCSSKCRNIAKEKDQVRSDTGTMFVISSQLVQYFHIMSLSSPMMGASNCCMCNVTAPPAWQNRRVCSTGGVEHCLLGQRYSLEKHKLSRNSPSAMSSVEYSCMSTTHGATQ